MSYDILVFDPAEAPAGRDEAIAWLMARPEDGRNPRFDAWVADMQQVFPSYDHAPDEIPPGALYAEYVPEGAAMTLQTAWPNAERLRALVHRLAVRHDLGFWDLSETDGSLWRPPAPALSKAPHRGMALTTEDDGETADPSDALLAAAVDWVADGRGPSYLIVQLGPDDYAQAGGGREGLSLEWRRYGRDGSFRHLIAATDADEDADLIDLPGRSRAFRVLPNERLSADAARSLLLDIVSGAQPTAIWHDITHTFTG